MERRRAGPTLSASKPRVLVTDGEGRSTVAICRSLSRAGYEVAVAASARPARAQWSRWCAERLLVADPLRDEQAFVDDLARIAEASHYELLLAGSDVSLRTISRSRARLVPHLRVYLPADDVVARSLSKQWLVRNAQRAELATPRTLVCDGQDEAVEAARELGFPLLVKSREALFRVDGATRRRGSVMVHNLDALLIQLPGYGNPCLVQASDRGTVFSYAGLIVDGTLVQRVFSRYRRTWYPDAGNVAFSEPVET